MIWITAHFVILFVLFVTITEGNDNGWIHIAGLFPVTAPEGRQGAAGILPAVQLALEHVNNNRDVLPHHQLNLYWNDTRCDMAEGTRVFFDMMHLSPRKHILFGDACSEVTVPIAETATWWNITQLSYADMDPVLSDRSKYPNFFRTVPSDSDYNLARKKLLNLFHWTRVATIFQDPSRGSPRHAFQTPSCTGPDAELHSKLIDLLDSANNPNIIRETESFSMDPSSALEHIKTNDLRIILGDFDAEMAKIVFCKAYKLGLYGPKYVWILSGRYESIDWWREGWQDGGLSCSPEELAQAVEGHIGFDVLTLGTSDRPTHTGLTVTQYEKEYNRRRGSTYSKYHGYAYDGVWVIARAIDYVTNRYHGDITNDKVQAALAKTNLLGVTGQVAFDNGDRLGSIVIQQFQGGAMTQIGVVDTYADSIRIDNSAIRWSGTGGVGVGVAPMDGSHKEKRLQSVNLIIFISVSCLAALGIVLTSFFFFINIRFRYHKYIKMSSPNMNNLILMGCMLTYCSVILLGVDSRLVGETMFPLACSLKMWVFCIGFTLSFGAMFAKTWRVHNIFTNIKMNKKVIKDYILVAIVNVLLMIDLIILLAWQILAPPYRETRNLSSLHNEMTSDVEVIPYVEYCTSERMTIFLVSVYVYKGLLLVIGCFLAWETRNVTIAALNDSKYIGMSVYNVVITCAAGVPVTLIMTDRPDSSYSIISFFILFSTTITLCLVFGPKLVEIRNDPLGQDKGSLKTMRKRARRLIGSPVDITSRAAAGYKTEELGAENRYLRDILAAKDEEIMRLLTLLGRDDSYDDLTSTVALHQNSTSFTNPSNSNNMSYIHYRGGNSGSQNELSRLCAFQDLRQGRRPTFIADQTDRHKYLVYSSIDKLSDIEMSDVRSTLIKTPSVQTLKMLGEGLIRETEIIAE